MTKGMRGPDDANRTVDDMIALLPHDLRSPVRALIEVTSWIEDDLAELGTPLPGAFQSHADLLRSRAGRVQALVHDMTNYAQIGRAHTPFGGNWAHLLGPIQRDNTALMNFDLAIEVSGCPQLGQADLGLLLSVLLSNASKHHHIGHGRIKLTVAPTAGGIDIEVEDDGPGIPEHQREQAMGFLTTLKSRDETEGSGMGLAIAHRIAQHYGANLHIGAPVTGTGCRVTFHLPTPDVF